MRGGYPLVDLPLKSGGYLAAVGTGTSSLALTQNLLYASPIWVPRSCTLDKIGAEITTAAASSTLRLGIYADDGNARPGAKLVEASATVDGTSQTAQEKDMSLAVAQGLYWLACVAQGGTPTVRSNANPVHGYVFPTLGTALGANPVSSVTQASVSGALPSTFTVGGQAIREPRIVVRVAP